MRTQDVLVRVASLLTVFAALWNILMSGIWFLSLVWVLIGIMWLVPMALAVVEILLACGMLIVGFNRAAPVVPLLGMFISVCNFNIIGFGLELMALLLMVGAIAVHMSAEKAEQPPMAMAT